VSERWLLALDTATSVVVAAAGSPSGDLLEARTFPAEHRHGSHLLPTIDGLARDRNLRLADLVGVVVGTGPGAFTGLRVGLATAKTLAHELGVPLVGISTAAALLASQPSASALLLPAGPHDRTVVERGARPRLSAGDHGEPEPSDALAVDLDGRASAAALARGARARDALPASLLALGAARLRRGQADDVARLVPEYVSLPRGVTSEVEGGVAWSRDPR
jgi:tRNA threonylcarbamoyl adenosine modification protein YeaZ